MAGRIIVDMDKFFVGTPEQREEQKTVGYDISGKECEPDAPACAARQTGNHYQVKVANEGIYAGGFFNPQKATPGDINRRSMTTSLPLYDFKKVSAESFNAYLMFLRTRNSIHLRRAERSQ